jgi:hypothetical protein
MLKIIAEHINRTGVVTETQEHVAISADCAITRNAPWTGSAYLKASDGLDFTLPVGSRLSDFQRVRVFGKDGTVIKSLIYSYDEDAAVCTKDEAVDRP